ncbi:MAG: PqiC family protein [Zoogloeaceae bacterium]|jgi:cholesterol transport system auxiliary component|nr:PqiC family protein [Zoogloeaceae bacterium]
MKLAFLLAATLTLAACVSAPSAPQAEQRRYDLGIALQDASPPWRIGVFADGAFGKAMRYRLNYANPNEVREYAYAFWADRPERLLAQALSARLAAPGDCRLDLSLERFEQVFNSPQTSFGLITATATLRGKARAGAQTRRFSVSQPAPTPDAAGGVAALSTAAETLAERLRQWEAIPALCGPGKP